MKQDLTQDDEGLESIGQTHGFCVDTSPDDKIHHIVDGLYISSQDGAHNFQELKDHKITDILNVATGVMNAFPEVSSVITLKLVSTSVFIAFSTSVFYSKFTFKSTQNK